MQKKKKNIVQVQLICFNFIGILISIVDYVHLCNLAPRANNETNFTSYKGDISLK